MNRGTLPVAVVSLAVCPRPVLAHGVPDTRFDVPIPLELLFAGSGTAVALTVLLLVVAPEQINRIEYDRSLLSVPAAQEQTVRSVAGLTFTAMAAATVTSGLVGWPFDPSLATSFFWGVWLKGVAVIAALVGSPWRVLSPWRTLFGLFGLNAISGWLRYPDRLGRWPAVVGFVAVVGIGENFTVVPDSPWLTASLLVLYATAMLVGAVVFGDTWFRNADAFRFLYDLFGRVSLFAVTSTAGSYSVRVRPPWEESGLPATGMDTVALVIALVYTVSYDAFMNTVGYVYFVTFVGELVSVGPVIPLAAYFLGLAAFLLGYVAVARVSGVLGGDRATHWRTHALLFAPAILPIAVAYDVAHNYPYVFQTLGEVVGTVQGELMGGPGEPVGLLSGLPIPVFWTTQVLLITAGHIVAVLASHTVTIDRFDTSRVGRVHFPIAALMVVYTVVSLWIVSLPVVK